MGVKEDTLEVIAKTLDVGKDELVEDKKLYDSIGVDSTEMVELCVALGKHFGVKIEPTEITKFSTPLEIVEVIEKKKQ
jgi:acyl carrier protein